jgi:hypothetical protein
MREYLLLLPVIFIVHDMEEIVGLEWFYSKNQWLFERYPKILKAHKGLTHMGFSAAVYEEFIPFFGVSLLAYYFPGQVVFALWYGIFLSLTAHFFIHIGQAVAVRKYVPCIVTSLICLPISIVILVKSAAFIEWGVTAVLLVAAGILLMLVNFKVAHWVMHVVNKRIGAREKSVPFSTHPDRSVA